MQVAPYLFFDGDCEAALELYKSVFGGSAEISRFGDAPPGAGAPEELKNRIMHATYTGTDITFMASDGRPGETYESGNVSLSIGLSDKAEADRIFAALSSGGEVEMPLERQFWGAYFGQFTDKYGIHWMINCQDPA